MARYGMVIDLSRCIGCGACVMACKVGNCLPPTVFWARILSREYGKYPAVSKVMVPVLCNHCADPACVHVCPTEATSQGEDGIVTIDDDKCVGCRYCMMACPYGSRYYHSKVVPYFKGHGPTPYEAHGYSRFQTGVVMKCNFCRDRIDHGLREGLKSGVDREATPLCVNSCMADARHFGDLDDPESEVSRLVRERHGFQLRPEFGTDPSVYYIR